MSISIERFEDSRWVGNMKLIICSGYLGDIDLNSEINKKVNVVLQKPFDSNIIIAAIENALISS